jgi:hypothetical protein
MPTVEESLFSRLSAYAGLTALIGSGSSCRAWPNVLREGCTYPAIVFDEVTGEYHSTFAASPTLKRSRYQVSCWGQTRASAFAARAQVVAALRDYVGGAIQATRILSSVATREPETGLHQAAVDVELWHDE